MPCDVQGNNTLNFKSTSYIITLKAKIFGKGY